MAKFEWLDDWKFHLGEIEQGHLIGFDDHSWRTLSVPHDWSIELPFNKEEGFSCTGFLMGGIGWYRKSFDTNKEMMNKKVMINFDGVYCRSTIYCNGSVIHFHPNGYTPFLVDITDYLNAEGEKNVLALRVDHSRHGDSRWYTGSGIYRKVSMNILDKVNIPIWGINVETKTLSDSMATIKASVEVINELNEAKEIEVSVKAYNHEHSLVAEKVLKVTINSDSQVKESFELDIKNPILWQIHQSYQYTLEVELLENTCSIQSESVLFGLREFRFDTKKGFFFNGKNELIKGVCLHHDAGLVGAAVPLDVWRRRLETLIKGGCNAIRTAHNQASEDFLNLCDELGLLVQEEFFDEWDNPKDKYQNGVEKTVDYYSRSYTEFFREYAKKDLQVTIQRDYNHPCIFQWSLGNEIEWTYTKYNNSTGYFGMDANGDYFYTLPPYKREKISELVNNIPKDFYDIDSTAMKLSNWTKELDTTRPVTANCILPTVSYETGYTKALDLVGYSYRRVIYDYGLKYFPETPIMGLENVPQWHEWKAVLEREHISGVFLWTGIDHIGEAQVQGPWPKRSSMVGMLDLCGNEKPSYHMYKSLWVEEPHLKMYTIPIEESLYKAEGGWLVEKDKGGWKRRKWFWHDVNKHWNYVDKQDIVIEVYSNCEEVSLYLNDELVSTNYLSDFEDHIYKWDIPYTKGVIKAIGKLNGKVIEDVLHQSGPISDIKMTVDKDTLYLNPDSAAHITAQFVDANGRDVNVVEDKLIFEVNQNGKILGVDNGSSDNVQGFNRHDLVTFKGLGFMIVRGVEKGDMTIKAIAPNLGIESAEVTITVV